MKRAISSLCILVLSLGSTVVLAENSVSPENTTSNKTIAEALPHNIVREKPLTEAALADAKTAKPLSGEFAVMSQPDVSTGIIQVTFGLFIVLLIIGAAAWFTRRFGHFQTTAGGALRIIGGLHLGTRERLVVVQVGDEQLLLGVAPGRVSTLHVLAKPMHQEELHSKRTQQVSGAFLDKLNAVLKRDGK
jgi:flagellar protein FliO/FliZ